MTSNKIIRILLVVASIIHFFKKIVKFVVTSANGSHNAYTEATACVVSPVWKS